MPRVNTAYVSRYQRARVHRSIRPRGDVFALAVDANAALAIGETIASIVFRTDNPNGVIFGAVTKSARTASVSCTAGVGCADVKAVITGSDGSVFAQLFRVSVQDAPFFDGETYPTAGATSASA